MKSCCELTDGELIAIDGKLFEIIMMTLVSLAVHIVNAFATENGVYLGEYKVYD